MPGIISGSLKEGQLIQLRSLAGRSKVRANWLRLCLLQCPAAGRPGLIGGFGAFPKEHVTGIRLLTSTALLCLWLKAEAFASAALRRGTFSPYVLGQLLELLPAAGKQRFGQKGESRSRTAGLYTQGPFRGIRRTTLEFPASTRLVCQVVRAVDLRAVFSSVALPSRCQVRATQR